METLQLTLSADVQQALGRWLRLSRQRQKLTLSMLASKSGVPTMTLSRLERQGMGSIDALVRALMALGELDPFNGYVQEQLRKAALPQDISEIEQPRRRERMRVRRPRPNSPLKKGLIRQKCP